MKLTLILVGFIVGLTQPVLAVEFKEPIFVNEIYNKQSTFTCNKQKFKIPAYFPHQDKFSYNNKPPSSDLYLTTMDSECSTKHFRIVLGLGENCAGQNVCVNSVFEYREFRREEAGWVEDALLAYKAEIELDKDIRGYFIPSRCYAYCNTAKLIWFNENKVFIVSSKIDNSKSSIDELIKSANSYINLQQ